MPVAQVAKVKYEKLGGVVKKVFSRMGTIAEDGLTHPFDEATQLTKGFAFVNFVNPQDAKTAAATLNGWQLDKNHNIKVGAPLRAFPFITPDAFIFGHAHVSGSPVPQNDCLAALRFIFGVT